MVAGIYNTTKSSKQYHKLYLTIDGCVEQRSWPIHIKNIGVQTILE